MYCTFLQFAGWMRYKYFRYIHTNRIKEYKNTKNPKKKMFICNLYRNDAMCISKGTTVRQKDFGTLEFPSSTRFSLRTKQHGTVVAPAHASG